MRRRSRQTFQAGQVPGEDHGKSRRHRTRIPQGGGSRPNEENVRRALHQGYTMLALGLDNVFIVLLRAPETRGQPLMDDE